MIRRVSLLALLLSLWTTTIYLSLATLELSNLGPIVVVGHPTLPEAARHGLPTFDWERTLLWLAILAIYGLVAAMLTRKLLGQDCRQKSFISLAVLLFLGSALYLVVIHPTFLLTVLGESGRERLVSLVQDRIPLLDSIYFQWGLPRLKLVVLALQIFLTLSIALTFMALAGSRGGKDGDD